MKNPIIYGLVFAIAFSNVLPDANATAQCEELFHAVEKLGTKSQSTAREMLLRNLDAQNEKSERFINEFWQYFRKNVWTKEQVAIADQLITLSHQKDSDLAAFINLLRQLRDSSGVLTKNFVNFEQHPRAYLSLLQRRALMKMEFYGSEHVILYLATNNAWNTKAARELVITAESKARRSETKNEILSFPNPQVSSVTELNQIELQVAKTLIAEVSWKDSDLQTILSAAQQFKKGVEYYLEGETAKSPQSATSAIDSIIALTLKHPAMRPVSSQEAYTLLSRLSGGSLNVPVSNSLAVLTAVSGLAKISTDKTKSAQELEAYMKLRIHFEQLVETPTAGDFAEDSIKILKLSPEDIL